MYLTPPFPGQYLTRSTHHSHLTLPLWTDGQMSLKILPSLVVSKSRMLRSSSANSHRAHNLKKVKSEQIWQMNFRQTLVNQNWRELCDTFVSSSHGDGGSHQTFWTLPHMFSKVSELLIFDEVYLSNKPNSTVSVSSFVSLDVTANAQLGGCAAICDEIT